MLNHPIGRNDNLEIYRDFLESLVSLCSLKQLRCDLFGGSCEYSQVVCPQSAIWLRIPEETHHFDTLEGTDVEFV